MVTLGIMIINRSCYFWNCLILCCSQARLQSAIQKNTFARFAPLLSHQSTPTWIVSEKNALSSVKICNFNFSCCRSSQPIRTTSFSGQPVRTTTIHRPNSTITTTKPIHRPNSTITDTKPIHRPNSTITTTKPIHRPNSTITTTKPMVKSRQIQNSKLMEKSRQIQNSRPKF